MSYILILKIMLASQVISYTIENRNVHLPDTIKDSLELSPFLETGLLIKEFALQLEDSSTIHGKLEIVTDPVSQGYQLNFSSTDSRIYDNADVYLGIALQEKSSNYSLFGTTVEAKRKSRVLKFSESEKVRIAIYKRGEIYSVSILIYEGLG